MTLSTRQREAGKPRPARWAYRRLSELAREFTPFGIVGGLGLVLTLVIFDLLISEHIVSFAANAAASVAGGTVAFAGNRYWSFRHRERSGLRREAAAFSVLNLAAIGVQQCGIELAKYETGQHDPRTLNIAFLISVLLGSAFRFWSYRKWVWTGRRPPPTGPIASRRTAPLSPR